ncbi:MAG: bifunctional aspartate transaminase/aspartate 4-decarboxylase [Deltaproteobacteria bacterium]|nr:bifunctional aspartate transaminase/aspartate 4-decarboxylase [Deltaproteobacteria bacterium]
MDESIATLRQYDKLSPFEIKDKLISLAKEHAQKAAAAMLNAGRGNPNWVATTPREAFFSLGQFAITESKRVMDLPDLGGMPAKDGIAARLAAWLEKSASTPGIDFLKAMMPFAVKKFGFDPDAFVHELVDSLIADNYPVPDRMLAHNEKVVQAYLTWSMCGNQPPPGTFDLFATEGGTAAMCYVFTSLMANKILRQGDTIALGTPIFSPYIEIPALSDYSFKVVEVVATQENLYQFSDAELAKLEDPKVKAFFLINPSNPPSVAVSPEVIGKLVNLVKTKRPDLIILTDDVYGTFVKGFRSLMADLPHNTIGVYSYSKYMGCTGWRLGVIALHEDNIIDKMIAGLPAPEREITTKRYEKIALDPAGLKFIDRLVADSRDVALNHTAGLSLPQQAQMQLFSLFQLMDQDNSYQESVMKIVAHRVKIILEGLGIDVKIGPHYADYYGLIDFEFWLKKYVDEGVIQFIKDNYDPLDIVFRLAEDHAIVLLNGGGFDAPNWSVRVSFANLPDAVYEDIGRAVRAVARGYVEAYRHAQGGGGKK